MPDITYEGKGNFKQCEYTVLANGLPLNPRLDLANHSPTGLSWGYAGSGPAQCALAILADASGDDQLALKYYQRFKATIVARFGEEWVLTRERVLRWLAKEQSPYGQMCSDPELCKGKGYCPRDPTCGD